MYIIIWVCRGQLHDFVPSEDGWQVTLLTRSSLIRDDVIQLYIAEGNLNTETQRLSEMVNTLCNSHSHGLAMTSAARGTEFCDSFQNLLGLCDKFQLPHCILFKFIFVQQQKIIHCDVDEK